MALSYYIAAFLAIAPAAHDLTKADFICYNSFTYKFIIFMPKKKKDPRIKVPRLVRLENCKSSRKKKMETKITKRPYNKEK